MGDTSFPIPSYMKEGSAVPAEQPMSDRASKLIEAIRRGAQPQGGEVVEAPGAPGASAVPSPSGPSGTMDEAALARLSRGSSMPETGRTAADYKKMSWGEYAPIVAENAIPSVVEAVKGFGNAVMNPIDTATTMGKLGAGMGAKAIDAAGNAIGYGPVLDPTKKAEREQVADAVIGSYKGRYGGGEEGEFWKNLAEDPASYLADVASVASLGAGSAAKLGLIDKAGDVSRMAQLATNLDPVQAAINTAGKVTSTAGAAIPKLLQVGQSAASGLTMKSLQMARDLGIKGEPQQIEAFLSSLKKKPNFNADTVDQLENAIDEMGEQASRQYMTSASTAFGRTQPVDLSIPEQARNKVEAMIDPSAMSSVLKAAPPYTKTDIDTARDAINQLDAALTHPNPAARTIQELDAVKKNIDTLSKQITDPVLRSRVQAVAGELVNEMGLTDSAYFDMMKGWQKYKRELNNVRKDFGTDRMSDAARSRKLAKAFKNKDGDEMFKALESTPSGANLRYSLAGNAGSDWFGDKAHTAIAGFGGPAAAALYFGVHPASAALFAGGLGLSSPKLGMKSQYALGKAQGAVNRTARGAADRLAPPIVTNIGSQIGSAMGEPQEEQRVGRRAGGRVGGHEAAADQLVRAAERAKKDLGRSTEPLLSQSDDAVAHALEVANKSI